MGHIKYYIWAISNIILMQRVELCTVVYIRTQKHLVIRQFYFYVAGIRQADINFAGQNYLSNNV